MLDIVKITYYLFYYISIICRDRYYNHPYYLLYFLFTLFIIDKDTRNFPIYLTITSYACSIPDLSTDSVIITGGYHYKQIVSRYDSLGFVEDLPSLLSERVSHGCGAYYRDSDGEQVSSVIIIIVI